MITNDLNRENDVSDINNKSSAPFIIYINSVLSIILLFLFTIFLTSKNIKYALKNCFF